MSVEKMLVELSNQGVVVKLYYHPHSLQWTLHASDLKGPTLEWRGGVLKEVVRGALTDLKLPVPA